MYPLVRACMLTLLLLSPTGLRADDKTECSWPMFRGGPLQTGVAHSSIPNKPTVKWSHTVKDAAFTTAAAIDAHSVFVGDDSGTLYAFDRSNGIVRWKINVGDSVPISSTPTIIGGVKELFEIFPSLANGVEFDRRRRHLCHLLEVLMCTQCTR